jgi:hypothetical protein
MPNGVLPSGSGNDADPAAQPEYNDAMTQDMIRSVSIHQPLGLRVGRSLRLVARGLLSLAA